MKPSLTSIVAALAVLGLAIAVLVGIYPKPEPAPPASTQPVSSIDQKSPYGSEQEWIVSSICRNAFELLAYAKDKKGEVVLPDKVTLKEIPGDVLTYDVTVHGAQATAEAKLSWPGSIWAPDAYVPFCQSAAQALNLPAAGATQAQGNPLHDLLDFTETAIEAENHRVSQWLAAEPDNAAAHEQAALILGTLAMKENSGIFWDPRDICNHVTTHLAVAEFLRGSAPVSIEGRLANICVGLIVDTKTQTGADLDALAGVPDPPADLAAWINAGRMRNSRDWRIVKNPETASGLELVEYVRAFCEAVDTTRAMTWMQEHSIANRVDWNRIILEMDYPVDAGHEFAEQSVSMEFQTMRATFPDSFSQGSMVSDLNEPPGDAVNLNGSAPGPVVISRGMWAQFFQRHLCHAIAQTGDFYANKWDVPDTAQAFDQKVNASLTGLTMFPYLQLAQFHLRNMPASSPDAFASFKAHPEWAPDALEWLRLPDQPATVRLKQAAAAWFSPPVVQGTAYGAMSRVPAEGWSGPQTDHLYAIAPLQLVVAQLELKRLYGTDNTLPQIQKVMGPLLDYYVVVMNQAAHATDLNLDQRADYFRRAGALSPTYLYELAQLYQDNHEDDKAAAAYQDYFDKEADRVSVSNRMDWLVKYYYGHGQSDKAMTIATDTATVYSAVGLETMMNLQEMMGNLDSADDYGQKVLERYNDSTALASLYKRQADKGTPGYQGKLDHLAGKTFPQGLKKVTLGSFSGEPSDGMKFATTSDSMSTNGLSADQVVVALDGYAVQNQAQYAFIRGLSDSPDMHFVIWDGKAYREVDAKQPGRRFGVELIDYHP